MDILLRQTFIKFMTKMLTYKQVLKKAYELTYQELHPGNVKQSFPLALAILRDNHCF